MACPFCESSLVDVRNEPFEPRCRTSEFGERPLVRGGIGDVEDEEAGDLGLSRYVCASDVSIGSGRRVR